MLINLSNHPSKNWSDEQLKFSIQNYGEIIDIQFPVINPTFSEDEINLLAEEYSKTISEIISKSLDKMDAVHLMGEFSFTYSLINLLKEKGIKVICSTTERNTRTDNEGKKISEFKFVRFREY